MKTEATFPIRRIWLVAILVSVSIGAPLSFLSKSSPWVMAIPIVVGVSIICCMELFMEPTQENPQLPLIKAPPGYFGLMKYKGYVALASPVEKATSEQWTFDFLNVQKKKSTKPTRIIRDPDTGDEIYLIDTERFVASLLARTLPNTDQIAEMSLLHALHRFGEMGGVSNNLEAFLRSKTVLEIIKADFRSNTAQTINTAGETVLRDAIKGLKDSKSKKPSSPEPSPLAA